VTPPERWSFEGIGLPGGEDAAWEIADGILTSRRTRDAERLPGRFVVPGLVDAHCHLTLRRGDGGPVGQGRDAMLADLEEARRHGARARDVGAVDGLTLRGRRVA
jgi:imidazolonepropionase-like amidohydrolase